MKKIWTCVRLAVASALMFGGQPFAFGPSPSLAAQPPLVTDSGWPRQFQAQGYAISVYQPQLESWDAATKLTARAAVSLKAPGAKDLTFGVIWLSARTTVDKDNRLVALENVKITKASFPSAPDQAATLEKVMQAAAPTQTRYIALDRLEAMLLTVQEQRKAEALPLKNNPPAIVFSYAPAILVLIDGAPVWRPVKGTSLQRILNTSPLVLKDPNTGKYYLHVYDGWMQSAEPLSGAWAVATHPPASLNTAMQEAVAGRQVDLLTGGNATSPPSLAKGPVPVVFVATSPTELIVIDGQPNYLPSTGTNLLFVQNTSGRVFKDLDDQKTYVLIAGRWFSAAQTSGPWTYVPGQSLPADFAKIPTDSPVENVLANVPGTSEAQEAVISNSIAQTATVNRSSTKLVPAPVFDGAPQLKPIEGTSLKYVVNSSVPIIMVNAHTYYAIQAGVWFAATSVKGPWAVATSVPAVIYSIPPSSPLYFATYAQIYGFTPTVVYEGYTPGYMGVLVSGGTIVYGTGYVYSPWIGTVWYGPPVTYGFGVGIAWTPWMGWAYSFGWGPTWGTGVTVGFGWGGWGWGCAYGGWYGPGYYGSSGYYGSVKGGGYAWGPGGWASTSGNVYSHYGNTSVVSRTSSGYNAYTGNSWQGTRGVAYNSKTGAAAAGGYGTVSNAYTGKSVTGGYVNTYHPTTGTASATTYNANTGQVNRATYNTKTGQTTENTYNTNNINKPTTTNTYNSTNKPTTTDTYNSANKSTTTNNVYADKNGQVYRQDPSGGWEQQDNSGKWNSTNDTNKTSSWQQDANARQQGEQRFSGYQRSGGGGARFRR